jgi:phospholipase C
MFVLCRPEVIPAYSALATEYGVFDRWFASVPASTQPNRFYIHSATSFGAMSNVREDLVQGFPQRKPSSTLFQMLGIHLVFITRTFLQHYFIATYAS